MTILVTGGAGFIGSNFVLDWLAQSDEPVVNLDKLTYAGNRENLAPLQGDARHVFVQGDIGDSALVAELLARHRLVENLVHRQEMPRHDLVETLVHRQHVAGLQHLLDNLHPADIAFILEALPLEDRRFVWDLVKAERDGEILIEVSDAIRESLIEVMDPAELRAAAQSLDADELADLVPDLPQAVVDDVFRSLPAEEREHLRAAMSYPEDSVGSIMDFDMVTVREDVSLLDALHEITRKKIGMTAIVDAAGKAQAVREVLLDRRPLFWVEHAGWIWVLLALCIGAMVFMRRATSSRPSARCSGPTRWAWACSPPPACTRPCCWTCRPWWPCSWA